jgi:hypothetical protein
MTWAAPRQLALLGDPIDERFYEFHHRNPDVYQRLIALAREWKQAGHDKCSIELLYAKLRWDEGIATSGDQFKLNDHFTSRYARLIQANERDLAGLFSTRALRGDES